jgi:hypothetical protein
MQKTDEREKIFSKNKTARINDTLQLARSRQVTML